MGFFSFLDPALNTALGPLLTINSLLAIFMISFVMTLILTLAYKFLTNQKLMKDLKDEIKQLQTQVKALKEKPEEMMKVQKQMMEVNMKYMMHSLRPTLITFLPIILIFGWLNAHLAMVPIMPFEEFTVTADFEDAGIALVSVVPENGIELLSDAEQKIVDGKAQWGFKADKGRYQLTVSHNNVSQIHPVLVDDLYYEQPISRYSQGSIKMITTGLKKHIVLNLFGWELGWLGTYLIFSIILSMTLRKLMKVY